MASIIDVFRSVPYGLHMRGFTDQQAHVFLFWKPKPNRFVGCDLRMKLRATRLTLSLMTPVEPTKPQFIFKKPARLIARFLRFFAQIFWSTGFLMLVQSIPSNH